MKVDTQQLPRNFAGSLLHKEQFMKRIIALGLLLAVSVTVPTYGQFLSGNELKQMCDKSKSNCTSFVIGAVDMTILTQTIPESNQYLCLPPSVDSVQLTDIVIKYLQANPETRDLSAAALIWNALTKTFPCKNAAKP